MRPWFGFRRLELLVDGCVALNLLRLLASPSVVRPNSDLEATPQALGKARGMFAFHHNAVCLFWCGIVVP